jgi:ubiquinone/menaquinone biosynthesis C-methylase UbiE
MYRKFALVYDEMMAHVDYRRWADYVCGLASGYGSIRSVLDLCCGTGNLTFPFAGKDCHVIGVDISSDMIACARSKLNNDDLKCNVKFFVQDMRMLDLEMQFDLVVCGCDGINYLLNADELKNTFLSVANVLQSGGYFIFDISSEYKLREILGDNTFAENFINSSYIWENFWDEDKKISHQNLTIFHRQNGLYEKIEEEHIQKAHTETTVRKCLEETGFIDVRFYDAFTNRPSLKYSERVFVSARKPI